MNLHACKVQKLPVPARNTIALRIARLDPERTIRSREGLDGARDQRGRGVGLKVLTGHGATIDTTTAAGKLVFGIFAALAEFERELISERTRAGLASARAEGKKRLQAFQDDYGQITPGNGDNGETRDPGW